MEVDINSIINVDSLLKIYPSLQRRFFSRRSNGKNVKRMMRDDDDLSGLYPNFRCLRANDSRVRRTTVSSAEDGSSSAK
ncbi:unnamed protein product [Rotaria sordida]|uniref:Uncharacterized protein n=1 Tax=Rotaria sordida TaxID=392033 RepID=A0A818J577_9BILA|nr:unnamed protein product [Rotaria sordida]